MTNYWAIKESYRTELAKRVLLNLSKNDDLAINHQPTPEIAIIEINGPIMSRYGWVGEATIEQLTDYLIEVKRQPKIKTILLKIDSPGGVALGITELTDLIYNMRETKQVVAWATQACSAAYLIGSACERFYASPMSELGSIGVVYIERRQNDEFNYVVSENAPLKNASSTDETGRQSILSLINGLEDTFIKRIGLYRKQTEATIQQNFGRGAVFSGFQALANGMIDGVSTFEDVWMDIVEEHETKTQDDKFDKFAELNAQMALMKQEKNDLLAKHAELEQRELAETSRRENGAIYIEIARGGTNAKQTQRLDQLWAQFLMDATMNAQHLKREIAAIQGDSNGLNPEELPVPGIIGEPKAQSGNFESLVKNYQDKHNLTAAQAVRRVADENPSAHQEYISRANETGIRWEEL